MRSKSPLTLIELIIMIAVFALAAALCLRAFVWSDLKSDANMQRDRALIVAQSEAEQIKAAHRAEYGTKEVDGFCVSVSGGESSNALLGSAVVSVSDKEKNTLVELTVNWQEGAE